MSATGSSAWETVIGLEVHCQLRTHTKLFCGCINAFGQEPNAATCPVCTGQPGAMPVLNEEAGRLAVRVALALGADVALRSAFDRKNYFYCDLPKGYQITQFALPYCTGGGLELASGKRVRLARIHMEEDAGKAIHDRGETTLVDLNRAGVPLIESVTEPDLSSGDEAYEYLSALKEILRYVGASDCDMEKGSLRCDVNVSVRRPGAALRTKVELKNLNSFRNVRAAIEHEVERQIAAYESGDESRYPVQETRSFDPEKGETRTMRGKEDAHDYRYFPEPDLPPLELTNEFVESVRAELPELPRARRERYQSELGLSAYDAGVLTADPELADFFESVVQHSSAPKEAANWISNEVLRTLGDQQRSLSDSALRPEALAELIGLVNAGKLNQPSAKKVLAQLLERGGRAADVVAELGLEQVSDRGQLEAWCRAALAEKPSVAADVRAGNAKALGALIGPVMQASGGKANPKEVRAILAQLIEEDA